MSDEHTHETPHTHEHQHQHNGQTHGHVHASQYHGHVEHEHAHGGRDPYPSSRPRARPRGRPRSPALRPPRSSSARPRLSRRAGDPAANHGSVLVPRRGPGVGMGVDEVTMAMGVRMRELVVV